MPFDLAMMSIQRLAMWFMIFQLPCWEVASTYRDARADVKSGGIEEIPLAAKATGRLFVLRRGDPRLKPWASSRALSKPRRFRGLGGENRQALAGEGLERGLADVHLKQVLEEPRSALEGAEDRVAKARRAVHQEQAAGHHGG
jgi:hypothetical protein